MLKRSKAVSLYIFFSLNVCIHTNGMGLNYNNRKKGSDNSGLYIVLGLIIVALLGFAIYWFIFRDQEGENESVGRGGGESNSTQYTPTDPPQSGKSVYGPLDAIGPSYKTQCLVAYSVDAVSSKYTGPIMFVRRLEGGGAEQAETFYQTTKDGPLMTLGGKEIGAWLGAGAQGDVQVWYDQSGNERHATFTSGFPKIKQDSSITGKNRYRLEFSGNRLNIDNEKTDPVDTTKYPEMAVISNVDIFKGPMDQRIMEGSITDFYIFKSKATSPIVQDLEMDKRRPLIVLDPNPGVDSKSGSTISIDANAKKITMVNKTSGLATLKIRNGGQLMNNIEGRGKTTVFGPDDRVKTGVTYELIGADGTVLAVAEYALDNITATLSGTFTSPKGGTILISDIRPTIAKVNLYAIDPNGTVETIRSGITNTDANREGIPVAWMLRDTQFFLGSVPDQSKSIAGWSPRDDGY